MGYLVVNMQDILKRTAPNAVIFVVSKRFHYVDPPVDKDTHPYVLLVLTYQI